MDPHTNRHAIEILESRIAPAVTVFLNGIAPNFAVTFTDSGGGKTDNTLEIHVSASSELEFSLNGAAFTNDLNDATPGVQSANIADIFSIAANLGTGGDAFTIGALALAGGLSVNAGTIMVKGSVVTGGDIVLAVDALDVQQAVSAGGHRVTIAPATAGRPVNLGGEVAGQLSITDAELDRIAASVIQIGGPAGGALTVSAVITPAGTGTLALVSGAEIVETGLIEVAHLRVEAVYAATLFGTNAVTDLAARVINGGLLFKNHTSLNLAAVDGLAMTSFNGSATFISTGITQNAPIVQAAGGGTVTIIAGSGALSLDHAANDFTGPVVLHGGGHPSLTDANDLVLGLQSSSGVLTVHAPGTVTQTGSFTAHDLVFAGPGTMIFSEANTSFAHITVTNGTLLVNGSSFTGDYIILRDGATLGGSGTIHGFVDVNSGGIIAPGSSLGVLHGNFPYSSKGFIFAVELNGTTPGAGHDQFAATGSVNLAGATLAATLGYAPGSDDHLVIISNDAADPVVGTFAGLAEGATLAIGGVNFTISYRGGDGNDVVLSHIVPVPAAILNAGKVFVFTDTDGDRVTITTTRGQFAAADFRLVAAGKGAQLQRIDLRRDARAFAGADIVITAQPTAAGGDGKVDVGHLDATGADLGYVKVPGDLGRIDAGDGDGIHPALARLRVESLGLRGLVTQEAGGSLSSHLRGWVGTWVVASDIRDATISVDGNIGVVAVGGSFVGGKLSSGAAIGRINIRGDIAGTALAPVVISAVGQAIVPIRGIDMAIGSLHVGGSVGLAHAGANTAALRLLAGYDAAGVPKNADASIGEIVVGGYWRASSAFAGVGAGPGGFVGVKDDAVLRGENVRDNPNIVSQISRIVIGTSVAGSPGAGDSFGILAETIGGCRIGTAILRFTPGAHGAGDYFFPSGVTGPGPTGLPRDFAIGEVKA